MAVRTPLVGSNDNVEHHGQTYHVQTEDSAGRRCNVITHLFADGGRIVTSSKSSYKDLVDEPDADERVRDLMRGQHRAMVVALQTGKLDSLLGHPAATPAPPVPGPPAPTPAVGTPERAEPARAAGRARTLALAEFPLDEVRAASVARGAVTPRAPVAGLVPPPAAAAGAPAAGAATPGGSSAASTTAPLAAAAAAAAAGVTSPAVPATRGAPTAPRLSGGSPNDRAPVAASGAARVVPPPMAAPSAMAAPPAVTHPPAVAPPPTMAPSPAVASPPAMAPLPTESPKPAVPAPSTDRRPTPATGGAYRFVGEGVALGSSEQPVGAAPPRKRRYPQTNPGRLRYGSQSSIGFRESFPSPEPFGSRTVTTRRFDELILELFADLGT